MTNEYLTEGDITFKGKNIKKGFKVAMSFMKGFNKTEEYFTDIESQWCRVRQKMWPMITFRLYSNGPPEYIPLDILNNHLKRANIKGMTWEISAKEYVENCEGYFLDSEEAEFMEME
jgi:hypothetical protein